MDKFWTDLLHHLTSNDWLIKIYIILFASFILSSLVFALHNRLYPRLQKTKHIWDDALLEAIRRPLIVWIWAAAILLIATIIMVEQDILPRLVKYIATLHQIVFIVSLFWSTMRFIKQLEFKQLSRKENITTVHATAQLLRVVVIVIAILIIMQTLNIRITALLAAGGIGGLAIGFAAKDSIANFIGGMMIYWDRPFEVGDWIRSTDKKIEGTVENIGWRLTRIRTFDKRPLYVPNSIFSTAAVENPSRMTNRRIKTTVGLRYQEASKIADILKDIETMLTNHPDIDTNQTLMVNLYEFGSSSLNFLIYTFTKTTKWAEFQAIQQDVFLKVIGIITQHGAECAFPTRTLDIPEGLAVKQV